jgi:hypothetical protein
MGISRRPHLLGLFLLLIVVRPAAAADTAVWVYRFIQWSGVRWEMISGTLPPGTRHMYASLEEGPRFLLDDPFRAEDVQRLVGAMRERAGIAVHATVLQDTRWLNDPDGARDRVARVLELNRRRPDQAFAGVHVDVEPHTLEDWECGGLPERRLLLQRLQGLLGHIAQLIAPPGKNSRSRLFLSATLPWWIGSLSADIPEASTRRWLESLDEIVLMTYGDPGGPLVGGSARAVLNRLEDARLWRDIPKGKGIRIGLATYEYASAADLLGTIRELDRALTHRTGYRGTVIFHHEGAYGAPLVASIRGLVRDPNGQPVAGARVRVGDRQTVTNRCGRFALRDLRASMGVVEIGGIGLQSIAVPVAGLTPGQELEIPPIVVNRRP